MLKMSRVYTLVEILSKIFVKKKENWEPYIRSWFDKLTYFLLKYIMRSLPLLARLTPLHLENDDKERNSKLSKMALFSIFLYTFTIDCVTTGARKMPIEYIVCFI